MNIRHILKGLGIAVIAITLVACSDDDDESTFTPSAGSQVGNLALDMIYNKTSDSAEPVDINRTVFVQEDEDKDIAFIEVRP